MIALNRDGSNCKSGIWSLAANTSKGAAEAAEAASDEAIKKFLREVARSGWVKNSLRVLKVDGTVSQGRARRTITKRYRL
jgi:hypothetical protein